MGSTRHAVLVGNGSFAETGLETPRLPALRCPAADVAGLHDLLVQPIHGAYTVTTLIDRPHNEIQRALYDCLKKAGPEHQVVIYYSGHGKLDQQGNLYLAGSDTDPEALAPTALAAAEVQNYVGESRAGARIVILDCCFSGAVDRIFRHGTAKGEVAEQVGQALRAQAGQGVFYLTASTDVQTAEEKDQDEYSLLTKHIIAGIKGAADANDDGEVRFSELCDFVQASVQKEGVQRPLSFALKAYGDPVVAFTGRPALAARREAIEQQVYALRSKKLLDGADAARVLNYIHGAGAVPSVMQALHDACGDDGAFLRVLYRLPDGTGTPVDQKRDAPSPVKFPPDPATRIEPAAPRTEDRRVSLPQLLPAWFGRRGVLVSIVVVAIVAGGVVWLSRPPNHTQSAERISQPAGGASSLLTAPSKGANPNNAAAPPAQSSNNQLIRPAQPLIKGSTQLIK
ncbi:MAG TPA: caspase family protein [Acetobacteraceae bacterium]|nr:caspase family protein [Acetobacteraceae bacterium]